MTTTSGTTRADALLAWSERTRRDLPWRRTRDPWSVLVSELMLQQTQVARVVPRYQAFLTAFPDVGACARAPIGAVIDAWRGLGYNRRAVNLHRCAGVLVEQFDATVPDDLDALLALPGVGPYTARAVLAFAFGRDVAACDINVNRVVTRWHGCALDQSATDGLVPPGRGWAWNQAVMDLGASVCTAGTPACVRCPVAPWCAWQGGGDGRPDPARRGPRQSTFAGSDRQGRGQIVDALRDGPVAAADAARVMGWPDDPGRAARVLAGLARDGLVVERDGAITLP